MIIGLKNQLKHIWQSDYSVKRKIEDSWFELKMAFQRAWRGYDDFMWWEIDREFVKLYYNILNHYREHSVGAPTGMTKEAWDNTLCMMINLLEKYSKLGIKDEDERNYVKQQFFQLFTEYFECLWD